MSEWSRNSGGWAWLFGIRQMDPKLHPDTEQSLLDLALRPGYRISSLSPLPPVEDSPTRLLSSSQTPGGSRPSNEHGSRTLARTDGQRPVQKDWLQVSDNLPNGDILRNIQEDLWAEPVPTSNHPTRIDLLQPYATKYPLLKKPRDKASVLALIVYLVRLAKWRWKNRLYLGE